MRHAQLRLSLFVVCLAAVLPAAAPAQDNGTQAAARVKPAVVLVSLMAAPNSILSCRTGVIVDESGLVATSARGTELAQSLVVTLENGFQLPAEFATIDPEHDVAILRLPPRQRYPTVTDTTDDVQEGQNILLTAYPEALVTRRAGLPGPAATTTRGMVIALRDGTTFGTRRPMEFIEIDAPVQPGNSGAPVYLADSGTIIGLLGTDLQPAAGARNFAIPVGYMVDLVDALRNGTAPPPPQRKPATATPGAPVGPPAPPPLPPGALPPRATATAQPLVFVQDNYPELPEPAGWLPNDGLPVAAGQGRMIADPQRNRLYVAEAQGNALAIIDVEENWFVKRLFVGSQPIGLAMTGDGRLLFVAASASSRVVVVDLEELVVKGAYQLNFQPCDLALVGNGKLYATSTSGPFYLIDLIAGTCAAGERLYSDSMVVGNPGSPMVFFGQRGLSPASIMRANTTVDPLKLERLHDHTALGANLQDMCLSPDGKSLYVCCGSPYYVQVIDPVTFAALGRLDTGPYPSHVAVTPDPTGEVVFASHTKGHVDLFNGQTMTALASLPVNGEVSRMIAVNDGLLALLFPAGLWLVSADDAVLAPPQ